ncbi:skin secretory protein xP2 isoform X10 [Columba livia]|uniref:skin secretory protein xP2 isoform X10 n=1 Tax=Columba livia TaxID=8932 RepID=UPI0031BAB3AE
MQHSANTTPTALQPVQVLLPRPELHLPHGCRARAASSRDATQPRGRPRLLHGDARLSIPTPSDSATALLPAQQRDSLSAAGSRHLSPRRRPPPAVSPWRAPLPTPGPPPAGAAPRRCRPAPAPERPRAPARSGGRRGAPAGGGGSAGAGVAEERRRRERGCRAPASRGSGSAAPAAAAGAGRGASPAARSRRERVAAAAAPRGGSEGPLAESATPPAPPPRRLRPPPAKRNKTKPRHGHALPPSPLGIWWLFFFLFFFFWFLFFVIYFFLGILLSSARLTCTFLIISLPLVFFILFSLLPNPVSVCFNTITTSAKNRPFYIPFLLSDPIQHPLLRSSFLQIEVESWLMDI